VSFRGRSAVRVRYPPVLMTSGQFLSHHRRDVAVVYTQEGTGDGPHHSRVFAGRNLLALHPSRPVQLSRVSLGDEDHGFHMPDISPAVYYPRGSATTTKAVPSLQERPLRRVERPSILSTGGGHVLRLLGHVPPFLLPAALRIKPPHDRGHGQQPRCDAKRRFVRRATGIRIARG